MKQAYCILPIYTADVSGVCSALYEFGGMVVMHDPSGCNSTYNTHDETRWFGQDSRIYISALTERDAILGNDEKFLHDVQAAAESQKPAFIALVTAPIPWMNGTDFPALAGILEKRTGIPAFFVETNGMHDYIPGAGNAFRMVAERMLPGRPEDAERMLSGRPEDASRMLPGRPEGVGQRKNSSPEKKVPINILGMTPLDYPTPGAADRMTDLLEAMGFSICSCWSMGKYAKNFRKAGQASVNLVVSAAGLQTAEFLQEKYGTPYVVGVPVPGLEETVREALLQAEASGENEILCTRRGSREEGRRVCIGEPVTMGSLAAAAGLQTGELVRVLCPLEADEKLLSPVDERFLGEEELQACIGAPVQIAADPMYRYVLTDALLAEKGCRQTVWLELPHEAMSGRCYRKNMRHLLDVKLF